MSFFTHIYNIIKEFFIYLSCRSEGDYSTLNDCEEVNGII